MANGDIRKDEPPGAEKAPRNTDVGKDREQGAEELSDEKLDQVSGGSDEFEGFIPSPP